MKLFFNKKTKVSFKKRNFLDKKKNKEYNQYMIEVLNGRRMSATLCCFDLNFFWKPRIINRLNDDSSKYFEFAWICFQFGRKWNIPLIEKR